MARNTLKSTTSLTPPASPPAGDNVTKAAGLVGEVGDKLMHAFADLRSAETKRGKDSKKLRANVRNAMGKALITAAEYFAANPGTDVDTVLTAQYGADFEKMTDRTQIQRRSDMSAIKGVAVNVPGRINTALWDLAKTRDRFVSWCRAINNNKTLSNDELEKIEADKVPRAAGDVAKSIMDAFDALADDHPAAFELFTDAYAMVAEVYDAERAAGALSTAAELRAAAKNGKVSGPSGARAKLRSRVTANA